jgi:hypothetical protein
MQIKPDTFAWVHSLHRQHKLRAVLDVNDVRRKLPHRLSYILNISLYVAGWKPFAKYTVKRSPTGQPLT